MILLNRVALALVLIVAVQPCVFAQTYTVAAYGGSSMPLTGVRATSQAVFPENLAPDGAGGFYFINRSAAGPVIYRVSAGGILTVFAPSPARDARGMVRDAVGNLVIADGQGNRVWKVSPSGAASVVAGDGQSGFTGDGGPAISARLNSPSDVAVDRSGNIFIADSDNHRIRKVTLAGIVSTAAGSGYSGGNADASPVYSPSSVAVDASGTLFIADLSSRIQKAAPNGTITTLVDGPRNGQATPPTFQFIADLVVDPAGNLFVADLGAGSIRKIAADGSISTVAAKLIEPRQVALGDNGAFLVTERGKVSRVNPDGSTRTIAGYGSTGGGGFSGDEGAATAARFNGPEGIAVDRAGNVYVADTLNYRVRRITPAGVITTVAGNGTAGFDGDGGPATAAALQPTRLAVDGAGNLFISESENHRVRQVTPAGIISTVAGSGPPGLNGSFGGDGGPATSARLNRPEGIAVDASGNLYIADSWNNRIRKVTAEGIITTVAGSGAIGGISGGFSGDGGPAVAARLNNPNDVAVLGPNLFVADGLNFRIRQITSDGTIWTLAGASQGFSGDGGQATAAQLRYAPSVAVDGAGNVVVADTGNARIRAVAPNGVIQTIAGTGARSPVTAGGPAQSFGFNPLSIAVDAAGNIFVGDRENDRVWKVTRQGPAPGPSTTPQIRLLTGAPAPVALPAPGASNANGVRPVSALAVPINNPVSLTVNTAGELFIADLGNNRVRKVTLDGIIRTVAGTGPSGHIPEGAAALAAGFSGPYGIAVDGAGDLLIADSEHHVVWRMEADGTLHSIAGKSLERGNSGDGGPAVAAQLNDPAGLAVDSAGNIFIGALFGSVRKISPNGIIRAVEGTRGNSVAVDRTGNLFVVSNHQILKVTPQGVVSTVAGTGTPGFAGDGAPAVSARLNIPLGVAADGAGNLFIADSGNHRIRKVAPDGMISTVAGNGSAGFSGDNGPAIAARLNQPGSLVVDRAGNLFIGDIGNNRVRKLAPNGVITTVAGSGTPNGDGGPAAIATLHAPSGVALDGAGNLFIGDGVNVTRKITVAGIAGTVTGRSDLNGPSFGIAADAAGNLFVADRFMHRILKISPDGTESTIAGNGAAFGALLGDGGPAIDARLNNPTGVAVDTAGNIYVADSGNSRVRKISTAGTITTVAGTGTAGFGGDGGPAVSAQLNGFGFGLNRGMDVAVDRAGNLFIVDGSNQRIRKVTPGGIITTVAGTGTTGFSGDGGPAVGAQLNAPNGIAVDAAGNFYISDAGNHRVRKVTTDGVIRTIAGNSNPSFLGSFSGDDGSAIAAALNTPAGLAVDGAGNLFIADYGNARIRKVTPAGTISTVMGN